MKRVALAAIACASPAPPPRAVVPPEPPRKLVGVEMLDLAPIVKPPQTLYVINVPRIDPLEPPTDAVLATDRKVAADADKLVRARVAIDDAIRKRIAARDRKDLDKLDHDRQQVTDQLVDLLAAHAPVLTADGAWLYAIAWAERSHDHFDTAYEAYLDAPDGRVEPKMDFSEAIANLQAYALRFPDAHQAEARIVIDDLRIEPHPDDATVLAAARDLYEVGKTGAFQEIAYSLAANAFDGRTTTDADIHADATVLRWLADHAVQPESRSHGLARLAELLYKQRDPDARDAFCRLDADTSELATTVAEYGHARLATVLVGDPGVCETVSCPCIPPVVEALATKYVELGDLAPARDLLEVATHEGFPDSPAWDAVRNATTHEPPEQTQLRHLVLFGTARSCVAHEAGVTGELVATITVGHDETTREAYATRSTLPPKVKLCVLEALRAQRWTGLADRDLLVPLRIDPR